MTNIGISKELKEIVDNVLSGSIDGVYPTTQEVVMAKALREIMEQKPIGYTDAEEIRDMKKYGHASIFSGKGINIHDGRWFEIYRAPVAPAQPEPIYEWHSVLSDMVNAMHHYEMDVDDDEYCGTTTPKQHREMMRRARTLIKSGNSAPTQSERDKVRAEHAEWSQATFGNVGPIGPLKHLSKEALEAAENPGDLSEWADIQLLLWDAQRRAGYTDEQITQACIEKMAINKTREWPEPKDGEPREHISGNSPGITDSSAQPVIPDGYCIMPKSLTAENGAKHTLSGEFSIQHYVYCTGCDGTGCDDCDESGIIEERLLIGWTGIKEIYKKAVETLSIHAGTIQEQEK